MVKRIATVVKNLWTSLKLCKRKLKPLEKRVVVDYHCDLQSFYFYTKRKVSRFLKPFHCYSKSKRSAMIGTLCIYVRTLDTHGRFSAQSVRFASMSSTVKESSLISRLVQSAEKCSERAKERWCRCVISGLPCRDIDVLCDARNDSLPFPLHGHTEVSTATASNGDTFGISSRFMTGSARR